MNRRLSLASILLATSLVAGCKAQPEKDQINLKFSPMYSGYDGVHPYKVPVRILDSGFTPDDQLKWSVSDPSMVDIIQDPKDARKAMLTTKKPGTVTVQVETATGIDKTHLTITKYSSEQWNDGMVRYTSGTPTDLRQFFEDMAGGDKYIQCTSCHGPSKEQIQIPHTPAQTGGFTDDELKGIFLHGEIPASQLDVPVGVKDFKAVHSWQAAPKEVDGLVAYLRSLQPLDWDDLEVPPGDDDYDGGYYDPDGGDEWPDGGFDLPDGFEWPDGFDPVRKASRKRTR